MPNKHVKLFRSKAQLYGSFSIDELRKIADDLERKIALKKIILTCEYCGREYKGYLDSVFKHLCEKCLEERIENAQKELVKERGKVVRWEKVVGTDYMKPIFEKDLDV